MAWNNTQFILIMGSLGQQFGQDTSRVASHCFLMSGPQLGTLKWLGDSDHWAEAGASTSKMASSLTC